MTRAGIFLEVFQYLPPNSLYILQKEKVRRSEEGEGP